VYEAVGRDGRKFYCWHTPEKNGNPAWLFSPLEAGVGGRKCPLAGNACTLYVTDMENSVSIDHIEKGTWYAATGDIWEVVALRCIPLKRCSGVVSSCFSVQVPAMAAPGQTVTVRAPSGTLLEVVIPAGATSGTFFNVQDPGNTAGNGDGSGNGSDWVFVSSKNSNS
jgi:hypothetical protein